MSLLTQPSHADESPYHTQIMPAQRTNKSVRKNTFEATNLATSLRERIYIPLETRLKYAEVGKPAPQPKPNSKPLITRFDPEFQAEMAKEHEERMADRQKLQELFKERDRIDRQIAIEEHNSKDSEPLINRLGPEPAVYTPPELPQGKRFRKTHLMQRQKEYRNMLRVVKERCRPILRTKGNRSEENDKAMTVVDCIQQIEEMFDSNETDKWQDKDWRLLKRDFLSIKRIDCSKPTQRLDYIVKSFADLYDSGIFKFLE